jgi:hypothetical protein
MPAFLKINGWEVPVAVDKGTAAPLELGTHDRSTDETLAIHRGADKLGVDFTTSWVAPETARALVGLLRGRGDHWSFDPDDTHVYGWSGKGIEPAGTYAGVPADLIAQSTSGEVSAVKYGTGCIEVAPATTNLFPANVRTGTDTSGTTTGFTALSGATLASSGSAPWEESKALSVLTAAATVGSGARADLTGTSGSTLYSASVYLKAASGSPQVRVYMKEVTGGSAAGTARTVNLSSTTWKRVEVEITTGGGVTAIGLVVDTPNSVAAFTFYADGFQVAAQAYYTAWVDGSRSAGSLHYALGDHRASDDLTVMFWARRSGTSQPGNLAMLAIGSSTDYLLIRDTPSGNENPEVDVVAGGAAVASSLSGDDGHTSGYLDWRHVAVTMQRQSRAGQYRLWVYAAGAPSAFYEPASVPAWGANPTLYVGTNVLGGAIGGFCFDDLVVLPYALDADQIAGVYALGRSFPDLPKLAVSGLLVDAAEGAELEVIGTSRPAVAITPAAGNPDQRTVAGSLEEA